MGIPENHPAIIEAKKRGLIIGPARAGSDRHVEFGRATKTDLIHKEQYTTLNLIPPSANSLFISVIVNRARSATKRIKSKAYREWLKAVVPLLDILASPESYPCRFLVAVQGKINRRDLDNLIKPCLDACVEAGVIPDDSIDFVHACQIEYFPKDSVAPQLTLWFEPIDVESIT